LTGRRFGTVAPEAVPATATPFRSCVLLVLVLAAAATVLGVRPGQPLPIRAAVSVTYTYTGYEQTFPVPAGVTSLHVVAVSAPGGRGNQGGPGGKGTVVTADITATPGQTLYIEVGGKGG